MEENGRQVSPYKGVLISSILLICVPLVFYGVFYIVLLEIPNSWQEEVNKASALALGFGLGSIFHLGCIIGGMFKEPVYAIKRRVKDFFIHIQLSFKLAITSYFADMKKDGVVFWIYFTIVLANLGMFILGLYKFFEIYIK